MPVPILRRCHQPRAPPLHRPQIAHRLARRERRSVAEIVERALEAYEAAQTGREAADSFYRRLSVAYGADIDLAATAAAARRPNTGLDL